MTLINSHCLLKVTKKSYKKVFKLNVNLKVLKRLSSLTYGHAGIMAVQTPIINQLSDYITPYNDFD